jgi:hypothetical protein
MKTVPHPDYPLGYVVGVGPAAKPGTACACGVPAVAQCQGCGAGFCIACWWKHSHTAKGAV